MITRIVHTRIWEDEFFCALSFKEKVVFLYLITNVNIGLTGAYECDDRHIMFDTGVSQKELKQIKDKFKDKIIFHKSWIVIKNANRYNNFMTNKSPKIKEGCVKEYNRLPGDIKKLVPDTSIILVSNKVDTVNKQKPKIKKPKKDIIKFGVDFSSEISKVVDHYKKIYHLSYVPGLLENSTAAGRLVANYGIDKVLFMIGKAKETKGQKYYPGIGNLKDLLEKWEKLDYMLVKDKKEEPKKEDLSMKTALGKEVKDATKL